MVFTTTLQQVAILLIFIFIGYFFRKINIITDDGRKVLAKLLVNLFAPCYSVISLSTVVNVQDITKYLLMLLVGIGVAIISAILAIPFAKLFAKDKFNRNILSYAFAFGNIGYFGYPLIYGVFGAVARAQMMLFCVPMTVLIYSYGYYILTQPPEKVDENGNPVTRAPRTLKQKLSFLYSMPMIGLYVGITLGLLSSGLNFEIPKFFTDLIKKAGDCQSAPAMLITGAVLAKLSFKELFTSLKPYLIGLVRLVVFPLVFAGIFAIIYLCGWQDANFARIAFIAIISVSMPVGMNTVVYPESVGMDSTEGAKTCFISYVMALITLPVIYMVAMNVLNLTIATFGA
ncbi:MAG: AEC family transporter [Clostridia bacterium]|nr:AEC family transporter [Clostridia bacterium]